MNNKSILLVNSSFLPNIGGVENSLRHLLEEFQDKGYFVTVVCNDLANSGEMLNNHDFFGGYEIFRYQHKRGMSQFWTALKLLRKLKKQRCYDAIVCRSWQLNYVLRSAGFKNIIYIPPALSSLYNSSYILGKLTLKQRLIHKVRSWQEILSYPMANKIIVFSRTMKEQVKPYVKREKIIIQPPGVDTSRFYPLSTEQKAAIRYKLGLPNSKKILLCLGRLEKVKGFHIALEAMNYLDDSYALVFVGDGSEKDTLKELAKNSNLSNRVYFFGPTGNPEDYFRAVDLFMFTSLYESFGQVLLESVASGTKVVGFSSRKSPNVMTAIDDIFENYPTLVEYADEHTALSLAAAVDRVTNEQVNYYQESLMQRDTFLLNHSWKKLAEKVLS